MDDFQAVNASIPIFIFFSLARRLNWNHAKFISVTIYMCLFTAIDSWPLCNIDIFSKSHSKFKLLDRNERT